MKEGHTLHHHSHMSRSDLEQCLRAGDMEDARAMREHSSRAQGISGGDDLVRNRTAGFKDSKWNEDDDDRETVQETFRVLDNNSNNTISIAEIESAASTSNDLLEVANVLNAHCRKHNLAAVDEKLFADAIKTIPRARGHRVQWAKGLSLHNLLASFLKPGTVVDGLKGLKAMSENEVRRACESFAKDATELVMSEWKALTMPQSAGNQSQGSGSNSKFSIEARYGTLNDFYEGPEKRVGYPNPKVAAGMQIEHCNRENRDAGFITSNYQLYTKPSWEWWYLVQLHPPKGLEITASIQTKVPQSLETERKGQLPGVYQDFFWETTVECSLKTNVANTDKVIEDVKRQLDELKELLKTDEEKCRGIKVLYDQTLKLSIVFPLQLKEHELQGRLKSILEASGPSMIDFKSFKPAKRTYVQTRGENVADEIQGRMPPAERADIEEMRQMMHKAGLRLEEAWALCLYTGPMFFLYNARLRGFPQNLINPNNNFETTIFVIISGIVKLSRVSDIPQHRLLYRGMGGLVLPPAFRDDSAECTVKLAVTFTDQAWDLIRNQDAVTALERESLEVIKELLSKMEIRQVVIARNNQSIILDVEVVLAKSRFDLLKAGSQLFNASDFKSWNFYEETDTIYFATQTSKQVATVESTPSIVAVVAAVLLTLKIKGAQSIVILDILREKPGGFRGGVELGLMSTTSRKEIAIQYSAGKGSTRGVVFEIQAGRIDIGASLQCFSQYPGEEEFLIPPCSCVEVVNTPRIEFDKDGTEVVVYPVRVNVNLKCVTVEELEGRRKELHLAMFSNLIEEVWSQLKEKKDGLSQQTSEQDKKEAAFKGANERISNDDLEKIMDALREVKAQHQKSEKSLYLHDNEYLKMFNEAMVEKHFAVVKFDLHRKTGESDLLKTLPEAIRKFPWEGIVGRSENIDLINKAEEDLDLKDWSVKGSNDLSQVGKDFLAEQLSFPVQRLIAAGVIVSFDPPNLGARSVRIRCEPQSLLNHVADRVAFLLSRYQSLCEVDIVKRAAFESLTIESWRFIFEDCPRLSTVNGSFMPNRLLRPTRGAGAALMVGYCQARRSVSLDLTNLALGNEGLKLIFPEMDKLGHLQYLFLDYNGLGVDCMQQFSEKILNLKNLKALSLDGNFIESNGVKLLCDGLKSMDSVERLSVKGSVIPIDLLPEKLKLPANILAGQGIIGGNKQLSWGTSINSVAWSPDRSKIAAGCGDGMINIFDAHTWELVAQLKGHSKGVNSVVWSPEGSKIASGSEDKMIIIWDAETGEQKTQLKGHTSYFLSVAWSPDGSKLASADGNPFNPSFPGTIIIWDAETGEQKTQIKGHTGVVTSVFWSPDGSKIASASGDKTIIIWDAETGEQKTQLTGHTRGVNSVSWSPEGSKIASGSDDMMVIIWDAETGEQKSQLKGHTGWVRLVVWSPEGSKIASGSVDKTIIIWDAVTGEQKSQLKGHTSHVNSVSWSPEGSKIASGSGDGTVIIWDAETGEQKAQLKGHTWEVRSVVWSPEGSKIASASNDKTIIIWDAETGEQKSQLKGHQYAVTSVAWSPEGSKIASGSADKTIIIWDAVAGEQKTQLKGHSDCVHSVAWSPDGSKIASASGDKTIIIWDAETGEQKTQLTGHTRGVNSVSWSPEGSKIASGSGDNTIIIWDAETGEQKSQLKGHTDVVQSVAWSPEGSMIASGSSDQIVILWDAVTRDHHTQLKGHSSSVSSVAWSPDGSRIASGSDDKTIITWDVKTGARLNDYKGHTGYISCVAWNPNGDLVASASGDQTVSIWDTRANCVVSQSKGHTGSVNSVSWSYDGERIATGSNDKSVMIWNVKTGSKISELKGEAAAILSTAWNPHDADLVSCGLSNGGLVIWDTRSVSKSSEFKGHGGGVSCVEWNKSGEKIASGSWDGAVKVWEAKSGSCVAELQGHKTKVISVVWEEEEGKDATIISQAADGVSITWNARTGEQIRISERLPTS